MKQDVTLREYIEALLAERDRRYAAQAEAARAAVEKAEYAAEKRFAALNELREAYGDTMPRTEVEFRLNNMADKIGELRLLARGEEIETGRSRDLRLTLPAAVAAMSSLVSVIFAMVTVIH